MIGEGRVLAVAGQIGWEPRTKKFSSVDFVSQVRQALRNVIAVVESAGGRAEHIIRLTWFITERESYTSHLQEVGAAYRETMGKHFPAMSVIVVAGLVERDAKVEIEATAILPK